MKCQILLLLCLLSYWFHNISINFQHNLLMSTLIINYDYNLWFIDYLCSGNSCYAECTSCSASQYSSLKRKGVLLLNSVNVSKWPKSQCDGTLVALCSLLVDYSENCRIDCLCPLIISLLLINHILHILRHFQITFPFLPSALINDGCPAIHLAFLWWLFCIFICALFCDCDVVIPLLIPCLLLNPFSEHLRFPVVSIGPSTLMIFILVPSSL